MIGGSNHEIIASKIYGRIDLSLSKISIVPKALKNMLPQQVESSPPATIHVNKRIDEKKSMSKTSSLNQASANIYKNINALNKERVATQNSNFNGSRYSFEKQRGVDYSYDEVLPQISQL